MRYRYILITFFLFGFCISGYGQNDLEDVVYLKNGGVTRGAIVEMIPDSIIKIQIRDKSILVYKFRDVEKVVKEKSGIQEELATKAGTNSAMDTIKISRPKFKQKGYHNITKFGPMGFSGYNICTINGYQFNPYLLVGFGVGLDIYNSMGGYNDIIPYSSAVNIRLTDVFLPLFLDFRYHVRGKSRVTFFPFFQMGYSIYLGGKANNAPNTYAYTTTGYDTFKPKTGGTFVYPGIGFKVFVNENMGLTFDFGIKFQNVGITEYNSSNGESRKNLMMEVSPALNVGIAF